jgi:sigma-B regulation protein RsbU (phosphoserine phosphatase)
MRILVVEDEADLLGPLSQALREAGYAVDEAADGQSGLSQALGADYDAIVLDLMLPRMDGFTVLRNLRRSRRTPVLMLTARDAISDRVHGLDAGADDYLLKPYELTELLARVRAMIRRGAGGALALDDGGEVTGDELSRTVARLESARRIQMRLTPTHAPKVPGAEIAFYYHPAQMVGGDYCDTWVLDDGRLAFVVADVSGKDVPAAMVMTHLHALLHAGTKFCPGGPAEAVEYVNRHLAEHLPGGMFVTLFLGLLDPRTGRLDYVNAGHLPPLLVDSSGGVRPMPAPSNTVLGIGTDRFTADVQTLAPGECLVAFTDGITESESPDGKLFGTSGVAAILGAASPATSQGLVNALTDAVCRFRGTAPQSDDVTAFALRWVGA